MNYQITCTCGHTFQRSGEELKGPVSCPACARPLSVVIQTPAVASPIAAGGLPLDAMASPVEAAPLPPSDASGEPTKRCPFCGEVILAVARKCKHCGEFLDRAEPGAAASLASTGTSSTSTATASAIDEPVFALTTSQWDNFWRFLILATLVLAISFIMLFFTALRPYAPVTILGAMVIAGFCGWFFYLHAKNIRTYIRPTRIDVERGILSRSLDSLELFRINDTELKQNVAERMIGIGTIRLITTDSTAPEMVLYQIPRAREVLKYLQTQIPIAAKQRGAIFMEK
jgi:membrane protein YdbS with pleckstrin-like domain